MLVALQKLAADWLRLAAYLAGFQLVLAVFLLEHPLVRLDSHFDPLFPLNYGFMVAQIIFLRDQALTFISHDFFDGNCHSVIQQARGFHRNIYRWLDVFVLFHGAVLSLHDNHQGII